MYDLLITNGLIIDGTGSAPLENPTHPIDVVATIYHAVAPAALQFLFPTAEKLDPQFGFTTGCEGASR